MFVHAERPMKLTTPLGPDALVLRGLTGREAVSELFHFEMDAVWEQTSEQLPFDKLLGQKVTVEFRPHNKSRYVNGIVTRITQRERDMHFTHYRVEVVPSLWLLTRKAQSRIFQQKTVPDILKIVLQGLDVAYELQGSYPKREYCVQYRETDFDFASRLMEAEGIYYFFKHTADSHKMVVADTPQSHPALPYEPKLVYDELEGGGRDDDRVYGWEKDQELRSGKYVTRDYHFKLPQKNLEAKDAITDTVQAGRTQHKLSVGGNDKLELYDYPGGSAAQLDGEQTVFDEGKRSVKVRMQQEALPSLLLRGKSVHCGLTAGHSFDLTRHFSDDGKFVVTSVEHEAEQPLPTDQTDHAYHYENRFTAIPSALPYRPQRVTPVPSVRGVQTATVVGPQGEEIYTDEFGRVKAQFHWDREGKHDAVSSCWIRVATFWAGKQWGAVHIPRIGQEVVVDFIEGNVDEPLIVGSVYTADMMPPYELPANATQSGVISRSSKGGSPANYNEFRFEDKKGSEQILMHAEKDLLTEVENDETRTVGHDRTTTIQNDETKTVKQGNETTTIEMGNRTIRVKQGNQDTKLDMGNMSTSLSMGNMATKMDLGKSETEAMQSIELKVGQSSILVNQMGVTIKGMMISIEGQIQVQVKGLMTQINGTAMLQEQGAIIMIN